MSIAPEHGLFVNGEFAPAQGGYNFATVNPATELAGHYDVNAIDLTGVAAGDRAELERLAACNVKRVFIADEDWAAAPTARRMLAFTETKNVWHPVGI